jgi:hypothetical protein
LDDVLVHFGSQLQEQELLLLVGAVMVEGVVIVGLQVQELGSAVG